MLLKKNYTPHSTYLETLNNIFDDMFIFSKQNQIIKKSPYYNIIENDEIYIIEIQLAGIDKKNIKTEINKNILKISAERKKDDEVKYNYSEIYYGMYETSFTLPESIDTEKIKASSNNGILTITIPKLENSKSQIREIEIL